MSRFKGAASAAPNNWKSVGLHDAANPEQDPMPVTLYTSAGVEVVPGASGTLTNQSSTVTLGGTSQQAIAANASRKYLLVQNPSDGPESFWVRFGAAAVVGSPSIEVQPGQTLSWDGGFVPTSTVNVISTTTGTGFTIHEG